MFTEDTCLVSWMYVFRRLRSPWCTALSTSLLYAVLEINGIGSLSKEKGKINELEATMNGKEDKE